MILRQAGGHLTHAGEVINAGHTSKLDHVLKLLIGENVSAGDVYILEVLHKSALHKLLHLACRIANNRHRWCE